MTKEYAESLLVGIVDTAMEDMQRTYGVTFDPEEWMEAYDAARAEPFTTCEAWMEATFPVMRRIRIAAVERAKSSVRRYA